MNSITLILSDIAKEFSRRSIFRDISFSLTPGDSLAITGRNGSGKSTLVKIICGLLAPSRGKVEYKDHDSPIHVDDVRHCIGLVSPYLQLYDEFTGIENLELLSTIRSDHELENGRIGGVIREVGLWDRRNDYVRTYSSGMKQRLKYAFALAHRPGVLILDEPSSNLDEEGIEMVKRAVAEQKHSAVLIVATNDAEEAAWCARKIELGVWSQQ